MRILHTSDLHLGKRLMEQERGEEYRAVFDELAAICRAEDIELVLIAGDVYDTPTPSAESMADFSEGVKKLAENAAVLVISGNHDDPVRLTSAAPFAEDSNVYLIGPDYRAINCGKRGRTYPAASGDRWVIMQTNPTPEHPEGEKVYVNLLPFPREGMLGEAKSEETFNEKMDRWIAAGNEGNTEGLPSILLAHIFVSGAKVSTGEKDITLGGAQMVAPAQLKGFDYCALGHIHKHMKVAKNAWYCGAPMQFAFDEIGDTKYCNVFDLTPDGVQNLREIELHSGVQLVVIAATSVHDALVDLEHNKDCYVDLKLSIKEPLTHSETQQLHDGAKYVFIEPDIDDVAQVRAYSVKNLPPKDMFITFYKSQNNDKEPSGKLVNLFLEMLEATEEGQA